MNQNLEARLPRAASSPELATLGVLYALSLSHFLNDTIQAVLPAIYPLLKETHGLTFTQIGLITLTFQLTASLLQPLVGLYTDRRPLPYSLVSGMGATLIGLLLLSQATTLVSILFAAGLVGLGSSVFHPEASRLAQLASGGRHGFAQALFQVGGNLGSSCGPLLAAWVVMPIGQPAIAWFAVIALIAMFVLQRLGSWYSQQLQLRMNAPRRAAARPRHRLSTRQVTAAIVVLIVLIVSKYFYLVSLTNYYTFFLIDKFQVSVQTSQLCLFAFLFAVAAGTIAGGPLGDRFGRKVVIWASIFGVAPFSLALPHANLPTTIVLSMFAGLILASAFSAILVFAQDLMPGRVGMVAGLFFGFAFGVSGIASAVLGVWADQIGLEAVFRFCAYLPLLGLLAVFLPDVDRIDPLLETEHARGNSEPQIQ
ncbi:MFS transporter [Planctomicrobium piriforme]|uniref:MFS transporter, FSR family, fosmidomycin resistance protein n=1 Tax=Planctomicrobium piriforme TaxID=1576369 RepID=A0A1I3AVK2_9PLAN|nr:MFS transporter [Planctomicrobium piriforme]SFH53371.1 MFS transporter, FSR family, fosmidomycin resistance protein [Planctomicrobium piriforme]